MHSAETKKDFSSPNCELGIILGLSAMMYWRGAGANGRISRSEKLSFWSGWLVLAVALTPPPHRFGEGLFSARMVQHELLMVVAAPLLALSRPLLPFLWALPAPWRLTLERFGKAAPLQSAWRGVTDPLVAWCVNAIVLWDWHAPVMVQAALASSLVHALQCLSFLFSALLFWWAVMHGHEHRMKSSGSLLYLFTTAVHTSLLGALLTFSPHLWYPAYGKATQTWGLTPLEDQQLGGLILWVPAGISYLIAGVAVTAKFRRLFAWPSAAAGADRMNRTLQCANLVVVTDVDEARYRPPAGGGDFAGAERRGAFGAGHRAVQ